MATKKPKTKADIVRDYFAKHPKTSASDAAKALEKQGVTLANVYATIGQDKKPKATRKRGRPSGRNGKPKRRGAPSDTGGQVAALVDLVNRAGGIAQAKAAIDSLAELER